MTSSTYIVNVKTSPLVWYMYKQRSDVRLLNPILINRVSYKMRFIMKMRLDPEAMPSLHF